MSKKKIEKLVVEVELKRPCSTGNVSSALAILGLPEKVQVSMMGDRKIILSRDLGTETSRINIKKAERILRSQADGLRSTLLDIVM